MDSKTFFKFLPNGKEYVTLITTKTNYNLIDEVLRKKIVLTSVRQKNNDFENDETHKALLVKKSKIEKEIRNYEYEVNNK